MKIMHVYAKVDVDVKLSEDAIKQLPKKVGLVTSIQHLEKLKVVQEQLPESVMGGQVLGCRVEKAEAIQDQVDAFLFIGTGNFHPIGIYLKTKKPLYKWDPIDKKLTKLSNEEVENFVKQRKKSLTKFYSSETVGILVSSKTGQNLIQKAVNFMKRNDKKYYLFAVDTLNVDGLQDFPFIDCWINTACPRIADEKSFLVNLDEILDFEKENMKDELKVVN